MERGDRLARKVKCKICGKELLNTEGYKITKNNKNSYYCSEDEYNELLKKNENRDKCLLEISRILKAKIVPPVLTKQVNELNKFYSYTVIEKVFLENRAYLEKIIESKTFVSEFAKAKYIMTIVMNKIDDVNKRHIKDLEDMAKLFKKNEDEVIEIVELEVKKKRKTSDITSFL